MKVGTTGDAIGGTSFMIFTIELRPSATHMIESAENFVAIRVRNG
jgi:hypothetical protein